MHTNRDVIMREYQPTDYPTVVKWWESYGFPVMPESLLPKCGLVIDDVCAGFLYRSDSGIAWMEFVVANPKTEKQARAASVNRLVEGLCGWAKDMGFKLVFTSTRLPSFVEKLKTLGFEVSDDKTTHLIRVM